MHTISALHTAFGCGECAPRMPMPNCAHMRSELRQRLFAAQFLLGVGATL